MKKIKISHLWTAGHETIINSVFFNLIKIISKNNIVFTTPSKCDLLILGPYNLETLSNRYKQILQRSLRFSKIKEYLDDIQKGLLFRKQKPITIFYAHENVRSNLIKSDFSITSDFENNNIRHLRFPVWKENIDWSHEGIKRSNDTFMIKRFGEFYDLKKLLNPLGGSFLSRKNICIFTSHMNEPRGEIFRQFSKHFVVDGYGPFFNKKIKNHNLSSFLKIDILRKYAFNLCPHNSIYPGYYEEKVPESFLGGCLPITWSDENIRFDFNEKSFVNLNNYIAGGFKNIIEMLKDSNYLKKFTDQPLLLKEPNLETEKSFLDKIIKNI